MLLCLKWKMEDGRKQVGVDEKQDGISIELEVEVEVGRPVCNDVEVIMQCSEGGK